MDAVIYTLVTIGQPLLGLIGAALMGVATWAIARLADRIGVERDHEMLDGLMDYADAGIQRAVKKLGKRMDDLKPDDVPAIVEDAAEWVADKAPIWASRLGFDRRGLREFVESRLP